MTFSSCLTDTDLDKAIVLDASVVINLLATGNASAILQALPMVSIVTENVAHEIGKVAAKDFSEGTILDTLIEENTIKVEELSGASLGLFFDMVSGSTSASLGDGEAATLAYAYENEFLAAIDEKKVTRIACQRFSHLKMVTTIDILAFNGVRATLGHEVLINATLQALKLARMQVKNHQLEWVVDLIGPSNAAAFPSLRRRARSDSI